MFFTVFTTVSEGLGSTMTRSKKPGRPMVRGLEALSHLRRWIAEGRFIQGLPSERLLAEELDVSRVTVRTALARLEDEGLLDVRDRQRRQMREPSNRRGSLADTVVVVSDQDPKTYDWAYPPGFSASLRRDTEAAVGAFDRQILRRHSDDLHGKALITLLKRRPAAIILLYEVATRRLGRDIAETAAAHGIRVVAYAEADSLPGIPSIVHDHAGGAAGLTQWLIAQGRRRILPFQLGGANQVWQAQRLAGYRRACAEHGLSALDPVATIALPGGHEPDAPSFADQACIAAGYLVEHLRGDDAVDALLLPSDAACPIVAAALRRIGRRPNQDVWLAGYDHTFFWQRIRQHDNTGPRITWDKDDAALAQALAATALGAEPQPVPGHLVIPDLAREPLSPYVDPWPTLTR